MKQKVKKLTLMLNKIKTSKQSKNVLTLDIQEDPLCLILSGVVAKFLIIIQQSKFEIKSESTVGQMVGKQGFYCPI